MVAALGLAALRHADYLSANGCSRWLTGRSAPHTTPCWWASWGAAVLGYVAAAMGYAVTAARAFDAQVRTLLRRGAGSGCAAWLLVPKFGLAGAAMAMGVAALAQIGGQSFILRRALRRLEEVAR